MKHHFAHTQKNKFYCNLKTENMSDLDWKNAERVRKNFGIRHLGYYHDMYVKSNTLLLADVFKNFRSKCLEIYEINPANFLPALV